MKGTEKQIAWAEDIRARYMAVIDARTAEIKSDTSRRMTEEKRAAKLAEVTGFRAWMAAQDDSRFWIDNRGIDDFKPWYSTKLQVLLCDYRALKQEGRI